MSESAPKLCTYERLQRLRRSAAELHQVDTVAVIGATRLSIIGLLSGTEVELYSIGYTVEYEGLALDALEDQLRNNAHGALKILDE